MQSETERRILELLSRKPVNDMTNRLQRFYTWLYGDNCIIRDVHANLVPLRLNEAQGRLFILMLDQAIAKKPIRINVGKARKTGISTFVQCLFVFLCTLYDQQRARTVAHETSATDEIFEIARLCASGYPLAPRQVGKREIKFHETQSRYWCQTAGGTAVGAGGTPNLLHLSELAKWEQNKRETEYNCKTAVPDTLESIIVVESTFKAKELFYQRFEEGCDSNNRYESLFIPWFIDEKCSLSLPPKGGFKPRPNDAETALMRMADATGCSLSFEQLAWRRMRIVEMGEDIFRQEYPATVAEAVQGYRGLILPMMRSVLVDELPFDPSEIPHDSRVGGIDFGYNDPTVIWSAYLYDDTLWVTDFWHGTESLARDQVCGILNGHTYYCDPANLSDRQELAAVVRKKGLRARLVPAPRTRHAGEDTSSTELHRLISKINNGRVRVVREVAAQLIEECDELCWNEKTGKPDMTRTETAYHYDSIMALKYLMMGIDRPRLTPMVSTRKNLRRLV